MPCSKYIKGRQSVKQDRFKQSAMHLVDTEDYREFHRTANQLIVEFPLVASWIKWYLNYGRAFHVFASLRNLSAYDKKRFKRLKKDTNAQEGIGGFIQSISDYKSMGVFHVLRVILGLVSMWETERQTAKEGVKTRYRTPTKSDKKRAREKPSTYKAPESVKRLL